MRSLLLVSARSQAALEDALASQADVLVVDLADAPAPPATAREAARAFIGAHRAGQSPRLYVRINGLDSGLADDDLAAIMAAAPAGIVLPRANGAGDVASLGVRLRVHEAENGLADGSTRIVPVIAQTPLGIFEAGGYRKVNERLAGIAWDAEALAAEIGASAMRDASGNLTEIFRLARAVSVLAAANAGTLAIDAAFADLHDMDGFRRDCLEGARDGFAARLAVHPAQIPVINGIYAPRPGR